MIINKTMLLLKNQLKKYLETKVEWLTDCDVILENPSNTDTENAENLTNKLILTFSSIEEERTMKNYPSYRKSKLNGEVAYSNSELYLNLYVLISSNFSNYENSLIWISYALEFFQSKNTFTPLNSPDPMVFDNMENYQKEKFKIITELHSINTAETNQLWENFGGKQLPHFMLKTWLVSIRSGQLLETGPPITEIQSTEIIS